MRPQCIACGSLSCQPGTMRATRGIVTANSSTLGIVGRNALRGTSSPNNYVTTVSVPGHMRPSLTRGVVPTTDPSGGKVLRLFACSLRRDRTLACMAEI